MLATAFPSASPKSIDELCSAARRVRFRARDVIIKQGERLELILVMSGFITISSTTAGGRRLTITLVNPGLIAGILAVTEPSLSRADYAGLTDGEALLLDGQVVRRLAQDDAGLSLTLYDAAAEWNRMLLGRLVNMAADSARKRLALMILSHEELLSAAQPIITRAELASLIGTSREMLGVILREFEAKSIARRDGHAIVVTDRPKLIEVADIAHNGA